MNNLDDGRIVFDYRGSDTKAKDLVCGAFVDPRTSVAVEHNSATYYFCSKECSERFTAAPTDYT